MSYHLRERNWSFESLNYAGDVWRKFAAGCIKVGSYLGRPQSTASLVDGLPVCGNRLLWADSTVCGERAARIFAVEGSMAGCRPTSMQQTTT